MTVTFEISRDPELLQQYYNIRQDCFRRELKLPNFNGREQLDDLTGRILIAHQHGECLGGSVISRSRLPDQQLREVGVDTHHSCNWGRLVLAPHARSLTLARDFCEHLIEASLSLGYHHAVIVSSLRNARYYRQCHSALGVPFKILRPAPEQARGQFAGLEHYLSVAHLTQPQPLARAA